jgi:hypothetical protein
VARRSTGTDYRAGLRRLRGDLDFPIANQATAAAIIERTAALGSVAEHLLANRVRDAARTTGE